MESKKTKVLYVDDEETNLFIFRELLKSRYDIVTASLPNEALDKLDQQEVDVVVTDMKMPQMNGVEFVRKAKEKHNSIPYFILTAFENNDEINEAVEKKLIEKCFIKPINVEKISTEISRVLSA